MFIRFMKAIILHFYSISIVKCIMRIKYNKCRLFKYQMIVLNIAILVIVFPRYLNAEDKLPIYVSILPQQYFVQQIGKDLVDVQVMVLPGASPETYEPRPNQMRSLGKAKIYFSVGVPFETVWLNKIAKMNPEMRIIATDDGIQKLFLEKEFCDGSAAHTTDKHYHAAKPSNGYIPDPHIWLSPPLVMMQARMIMLGLQQADPDRREIYAQNYRAFMLKLVDIDDQLRSLFTDIRAKHFMVLHPAWGYFAQAYGLTQIPVEIEGKSPKPTQLEKIIEYARQHDLTIILAQPQSLARYAEQVAKAINGQVIYADPLSPDWDKNLLEVAVKIKTALK